MSDSSTRSADHRLRMLIADDDRDAAESLCLLMQLEGHAVHMAHDGAEALDLALRIRPQVAILDIGMPVLDGHMVARSIRESLPGTRMLIVALTGHELATEQPRTLSTGFDHHFVKPLVLGRLRDCISRWREAGGADAVVQG